MLRGSLYITGSDEADPEKVQLETTKGEHLRLQK